MSLIHKALKKNDGGDAPMGPADPEEAFVGKGGGFFSAQVTPRTLILLVLALGTLGFMIYRNILKKPTPPQPVAATESAATVQPDALPAGQPPAAPLTAGGVATTTDRLTPAANVGAGSKEDSMPPLPPEIAGLVEEGKALFLAGQYDAALEKLTAAAAKAPKEAVIWNNIGLVQKRKQQLAEAEQAYQKALELQPAYPEGLNNMGVLKAAQGDRLSATLYLKKALAADPTYADAHFNLAVILEQEGNWKSAVEAYKAFLQYTASTDKALLEQVERRVEELSQ